ncbi:CpsD/CapB family tyrosine-protein kinase [Halobacillus salinarum]|uniref:CpsD/CapB family tyrosine-protein kinase n=1 Tax=Halobacillus salinarum TaxID=2932257 RepID=A0ABY4ELT7_9BACI|nr:CpsD/CapB family tyrosine-protein kinase [Halobacillus salinarum]UOQ45414.1 CpsD/CapB family tyrosine-protein kinase [Halobacillus salinarum]
MRKPQGKKNVSPMKLREELISTEQIRMIRTNLEHVSRDKPVSIMVSSPTYQPQKSLITAKLAMTFAEQGKKVMLVDADLRNPSLHHWFQIENRSGLTDVILHHGNVNQHHSPSYLPGLFILPTGPIPHSLSGIWNADKIQDFVLTCKRNYDVILFEACDYLSVSDSQVLANHCDGVILVLRSNKTKKTDVLRTKEALEKTNKKVLGVIHQTA